MLFSLADFRAKRILLEERGLTGLSRFTCTDEMRIKPAILFTRGHFKVHAPLMQRSNEHSFSAVSLSFPSFNTDAEDRARRPKVGADIDAHWPISPRGQAHHSHERADL